MPTNEERREVSKKIRELTEDVWSLAKEWEEEGIFTNGQDQADYYQIHFAILALFQQITCTRAITMNYTNVLPTL